MRYAGDMYECDRCGKKAFLTSDAPARADWMDVERVTAEGQRKTVLMCPACYALYKDVVKQDEQNFNKFMGSGVEK